MVFLGQMKSEVAGTTKRQSNATPPASQVRGDGAVESAQAKNLKKQYNKAHKDGDHQKAIDIKKKDVEAMPDGSIAVTFINGAVRMSEQEEMVQLLRRKSGLIVAHGSCSHLGGIPGLGNFWNKETIFNRAYHTTPSTENPDGTVPLEECQVDGHDVTLPAFWDTVKCLDQVIDVDYYLPGCTVPPDLIMNAVTAILSGELPPKGSVLAPNKSLCDECDRNETKPEKIEIGIAYGTEKRHWLQWAAQEFAATEDGRRILIDLIPMGSMEAAHAVFGQAIHA